MLDTSADAFIGGWTCRVPPFSGVGNSSRLPMHVSNSKPKPRRKDPPLTVREALKEQTHQQTPRLSLKRAQGIEPG
jgi:hypothetical protein